MICIDIISMHINVKPAALGERPFEVSKVQRQRPLRGGRVWGMAVATLRGMAPPRLIRPFRIVRTVASVTFILVVGVAGVARAQTAPTPRRMAYRPNQPVPAGYHIERRTRYGSRSAASPSSVRPTSRRPRPPTSTRATAPPLRRPRSRPAVRDPQEDGAAVRRRRPEHLRRLRRARHRVLHRRCRHPGHRPRDGVEGLRGTGGPDARRGAKSDAATRTNRRYRLWCLAHRKILTVVRLVDVRRSTALDTPPKHGHAQGIGRSGHS